MSEETKDQTANLEESTGHDHNHEHDHAHDHDHGHDHDHEPKMEPIMIELDDLTEEGKKKAEEALKRSIADLPYTLTLQENRPASVLAFKVEIAHDVFEAEQARLLNDLRKEAVLPGFRKGKVPVKLLQRRLGEDAVRDTVRVMGTNVLRQETLKQGLKFLTRPQIIAYAVTETAVSFEIEGETEPKVEVKEYKGLSVEVGVKKIEDAQIDERLEALRGQNAVMESAGEDATVAEGDNIAVDIEVFNDKGERMDNYSHQDQILYNYKQNLPEPVAAQIEGKKTGETVEADVEHKTTNRRGEEVAHCDHYKVTIKEIKRSKLPALDDEFAKDLGEYETLDALRAKVRKDLEEDEERRQRQDALTKLYRQLIEKNPIDAPKSLTSQQTYRLIADDQHQLSRYGLKLEQVIQDPNKYLADQQANALEMVKIQLLLSEIGKIENLDISDADVDQAIEAEAEKTGRKALAVRARLEATKQLDAFRQQVSQKKLSDYLLANNTVTTVPWQEPAAPAAEAAGEGEAKPE
jgi:trigger factor